MLLIYSTALTVTKGKPLARGENYVVVTGKKSLRSLSKIGKKYLLLSLEFVFLLLPPVLEKMLEKQKTDIWKGLCSLWHPAFTALCGVHLPRRKEEQGPGSCRMSAIAPPSIHSMVAGHLAVGSLLAPLHIWSITAASKYLLYLCTSRMWKALAFLLSLVPIQRTSHCGSIVF